MHGGDSYASETRAHEAEIATMKSTRGRFHALRSSCGSYLFMTARCFQIFESDEDKLHVVF